jgi:hypothetical protein
MAFKRTEIFILLYFVVVLLLLLLINFYLYISNELILDTK